MLSHISTLPSAVAGADTTTARTVTTIVCNVRTHLAMAPALRPVRFCNNRKCERRKCVHSSAARKLSHKCMNEWRLCSCGISFLYEPWSRIACTLHSIRISNPSTHSIRQRKAFFCTSFSSIINTTTYIFVGFPNIWILIYRGTCMKGIKPCDRIDVDVGTSVWAPAVANSISGRDDGEFIPRQ